MGFLMLSAIRKFGLAWGVSAGCVFFSATAFAADGAGLDAEKAAAIKTYLQTQVDQGFPGGQLVVMRAGRVVLEHAFGYIRLWDDKARVGNPRPTDSDVLFDLASNTKIYATVLSLMHLVYQGKIDIDDPVSKYMDGFADEAGAKIIGKHRITLRDLLAHKAGFASDPRYFDPEDPRIGKTLYSQERALTLQKLAITPLVYPPGAQHRYSDVDFMLLGAIIEKVTAQRLDDYVQATFFRPLGLKHIVFNPLSIGFSKNQIAATELLGNTRDGVFHFPNIRQHTIQGEVHDEKAFYSMGGVSGHAGLFGPAKEVAVLAQLFLSGGSLGDKRFFSSKEVDLFTTPEKADASFGLGWRLNQASRLPWFSSLASPKAFGHTGWTGVVTVIDPQFDLVIVLLTNRKHSPVLKPTENPDRFVADTLPLGAYTPLVQMVYEALE